MSHPKKGIAALLFTAMLTSIGSVPASAERIGTVTLEQAQQDIRARIQYGLERGLITPDEARAFYRRERDIQFRDMRFRQNAHASPRERDQLWRDIDTMRVDVERKLNGHHAQRPLLRLDQRHVQLNDKTNRGLASGLIRRDEAQQLQQRQRDISRREARLQAHGNLTRVERERLHRDLDKLE